MRRLLIALVLVVPLAGDCSLFADEVACDDGAPCAAGVCGADGFCTPAPVDAGEGEGDAGEGDAGEGDAGEGDAGEGEGEGDAGEGDSGEGEGDAGEGEGDAGEGEGDAGEGEGEGEGEPPPATCDADAVFGDYCADDKITNGQPNILYRCNGPGPATIHEKCPDGCVIAPPGQDDFCA